MRITLRRVRAPAPHLAKTRRQERTPSGFHLQVESLEQRLVLSHGLITDMTELAQLFPQHAGPTILYLNFDGDTANGGAPFEALTDNRDRNIQEILYRTAEIFAPFDVKVQRLFGNGVRDNGTAGNTTIFVGDRDPNRSLAWTPWESVDFPGRVHGIFHRPNSNPNDVAFVDPIMGNGTSQPLNWIVQAIAHEAGHTFGLAHIRTNGTDPNALSPGTIPEMMSYDSPNQRFIDQTFNITEYNFDGTDVYLEPNARPRWHWKPFHGFPFHLPVDIQTQNSFTYLQAILGSRPLDDYGNVVHTDSVDTTAYYDGLVPFLSVGSLINGAIERTGDYDVFRIKLPSSPLTMPANQWVRIDVQATWAPGFDDIPLNPVVLVYDQGGELVAFNNNISATNLNSRVTISLNSGQTYRIVVGASDSNWTGAYQVLVNSVDPQVFQRGGLASFQRTTSSLDSLQTAFLAMPGAAFEGFEALAPLLLPVQGVDSLEVVEHSKTASDPRGRDEDSLMAADLTEPAAAVRPVLAESATDRQLETSDHHVADLNHQNVRSASPLDPRAEQHLLAANSVLI